jgi:hypothetical protein
VEEGVAAETVSRSDPIGRLEPGAGLPRPAYLPSVLAGGLTPRGVGDFILG